MLVSSEASPWLPEDTFSLYPHKVPQSVICVLIPFSHKDTGHIGLGPTYMTSFYLNYLFKGLISKYSHILSHNI